VAAGHNDQRMIQLGDISDAVAEVAGTEQDTAEAWHHANHLAMFKRLRGFNLKDHHSLTARVGEVIGRGDKAELPVDITVVDGAMALWMEADPVDDLPRLAGVSDMRLDNASGLHLERLDVVAVAALGGAHQRVDVVDARGADLVLQSDPVVRHLLVAETLPVDTAESGDFHDPRVGKVILSSEGIWPARRSRRMRLGRSCIKKGRGRGGKHQYGPISDSATSRPPDSRLRMPAMTSFINSTVSLKG